MSGYEVKQKINVAMLASVIGLIFQFIMLSTFILINDYDYMSYFSNYFYTIFKVATLLIIIYLIYLILVTRIKNEIEQEVYINVKKIYLVCFISFIYGGFVAAVINMAILFPLYFHFNQLGYLKGTNKSKSPYTRIILEYSIDRDIKTCFNIIRIVTIVLLFAKFIFTNNDLDSIQLISEIILLILFLICISKLTNSLLNKKTQISSLLIVSSFIAGYITNYYMGYAVVIFGLIFLKDIYNLQTLEKLRLKRIEMSDEQRVQDNSSVKSSML